MSREILEHPSKNKKAQKNKARGAELTLAKAGGRCPNCRKGIREGNKFCKHCGAKVEEDGIGAEEEQAPKPEGGDKDEHDSSEVPTSSGHVQTRAQLQTRSMLPAAFDQTIEMWLKRCELWGKLNYFHVCPYKKRKERISKARALHLWADLDLTRMYGKWVFKELAINAVESSRTFRDLDGKERIEKIILVADLVPEMKRSLGWKWKLFRW
ncbi:zinc ribbon domain-containing protein [candidate division NPL-UPA2 bacterium]|nr:zinc ribbon domain-containing protein [candidate division NPL-UPA2 bacterium]